MLVRFLEWLVGAGEEEADPSRVLRKQLERRALLFVFVFTGAAWLSLASLADPQGALYAARHGALSFLAVVSAGWWWFLLPTAVVVGLWLGAYLHDHPWRVEKARPSPGDSERGGSRSAYRPTPVLRSWLTAANRLVVQLCAAVTAIFAAVVFADDFLLFLVLVSFYLIVATKATQRAALGCLNLSRVRRWTGAPSLTMGEVIYAHHGFYPVVIAAGFIYLSSRGEDLNGLRQLGYVVSVLVVAHALFAAIWLRFSLRGQQQMTAQERSARATYRSAAAHRSRWEGAGVVAALVVCAFLPFRAVLGVGEAAQTALQERLALERSRYECLDTDLVTQADLAIFLVSDNQFRALHGETSVAHSPLIDALVPVAVRPVELDLLSVASLDHFARLYRRMRRQAEKGRLYWAHLGDFGDLACKSELDRLEGRVARFGIDTLAGIAPGNHDSFFTGNFSWHPDWSADRACRPGGPVSRTGDAALASMLHDVVEQQPGIQRSPEDASFFASVSTLGSVGAKAVTAVFLDTSDFSGTSAGAAGAQGEISSEQADWVVQELTKHPESHVLIFQHHPVDDLSFQGGWRLDAIAEATGERLIAVITAHTHQSQHRKPIVGGRPVDEFIVGSTTDPPEEAALLLLTHERGGVAVRFQTIPAVARLEDCTTPAITGAQCRAILDGLEALPSCAPLLSESPPEADCSTESTTLKKQACEMEHRAKLLFNCTERTARNPLLLYAHDSSQPSNSMTAYDEIEPGCVQWTPPSREWSERGFTDPLIEDPTLYRALQEDCVRDNADDPNHMKGRIFPEARHRELVCLSWVASVLQDLEEEDGWNFGRARNFAFERLAANDAWAFPAEDEAVLPAF